MEKSGAPVESSQCVPCPGVMRRTEHGFYDMLATYAPPKGDHSESSDELKPGGILRIIGL